jgi:hypothetical protein
MKTAGGRLGAALAMTCMIPILAGCVAEPAAQPGSAPASEASAAPTPKPGEISAEVARSRLAVMLGIDATALKSDGIVPGRAGDVYVLSGDGLSAQVDARSGRVVLVAKRPSTHTGTAKLTQQDGLSAAERYVSAASRDVTGMTCTATALEAGGLSIWSVEYVRLKGEIELPDRVKVDIDAFDGQLVTYMDLARPYVDPPAPRMTRAVAIQTAIEKSGGQGKPGGAKLVVMFTASGRQILVWQVSVDNGTGYGPKVYLLDDQTGELTTDAMS